MNRQSLTAYILVMVLRISLVLVLVLAFLSLYLRLPAANNPQAQGTTPLAETMLTIKLRLDSADPSEIANLPIELYPLDVMAVREEFVSTRREGVSFEEFLRLKLAGATILKAQLDQTGESVLMVPQGRWWLYATLNGSVQVEWRIALNVTERRQLVELTSVNEYMRSQEF